VERLEVRMPPGVPQRSHSPPRPQHTGDTRARHHQPLEINPFPRAIGLTFPGRREASVRALLEPSAACQPPGRGHSQMYSEVHDAPCFMMCMLQRLVVYLANCDPGRIPVPCHFRGHHRQRSIEVIRGPASYPRLTRPSMARREFWGEEVGRAPRRSVESSERLPSSPSAVEQVAPRCLPSLGSR